MFQISAWLSPTTCPPPEGHSPLPCSVLSPSQGWSLHIIPQPRASPPMASTSKEGAWSPRGGRAEASSPARALQAWAVPNLRDKELC